MIGSEAHIGAYVVVGPNVRIGSHATLLPHVVLYPGVQVGDYFFAHAHAVVRENCVLGDHVTLENGAIIGADGFGFSKNDAGQWEKIPQSGPVRIGSRVDVQANATIDRATVGATEIGDGTKVDNLVQVGHGSRVGNDSLLCAQTGLAGSSIIGNNVILAGQVGIAGHCTVGDGVILTAQSAVSHDVPPGKMISGSPGFDNRIWLRAVTIFQRLPELLKRLDRVEKAVAKQLAASEAAPPDEEAAQMSRRAGLRSLLCAATVLSAFLFSACHSYHIDATVENHTGAPIQLLEVDYPSASFGVGFVGRQLPTSITGFRSAAVASSKSRTPRQTARRSRSPAPHWQNGSKGTLEIVLEPGGKAEFHPQLTPPA